MNIARQFSVRHASSRWGSTILSNWLKLPPMKEAGRQHDRLVRDEIRDFITHQQGDSL
jgi:hypothetical protein